MTESRPVTTEISDADAIVRREQIGSDLARTVMTTAARRLVEAIGDFDAGLDARVPMSELQRLDQEVARAERHRDALRDRLSSTRGAQPQSTPSDSRTHT